MLTIILFFALAAYLYERSSLVAYIVASIGIAAVFCLPLAGYNQAQLVQEAQLMPILETKNENDNEYVLSSKQGIYAYRKVDEDDSEQGMLGATSKFNTTVEIVPIEKNEQPRMCKYVSKAKCGWFTFAFWTAKTKYVFYIPSET